ncbi:hypothetical protein CRG98_041741 [Punica granatum]|uniref:inorganic diphosphatase n=1 Tax=Punica granatum TaxID=22663 RepID=A0A2I0I1N7_PUNGR|nr:hypothetical protein CRG98_041741 [Punica granatum]
MATARVIPAAAAASCLFSKTPFLRPLGPNTLCFNRKQLSSSTSRRLFTCSAIYNPQGTLTAIRDWFRDYKIPDGKPANKFGLGNKPANKDYALKVITETNESWAKLVKRSIPPGELSLV